MWAARCCAGAPSTGDPACSVPPQSRQPRVTGERPWSTKPRPSPGSDPVSQRERRGQSAVGAGDVFGLPSPSKTGFRFAERLKGRHRDVPCTPSPHMRRPHQKARSARPINLWGHVAVPRSPGWAASRCHPFCGFGRVWDDRCPPCGVGQGSVTAPESVESTCSCCVPTALSSRGRPAVGTRSTETPPPPPAGFFPSATCVCVSVLFAFVCFPVTTPWLIFKAMTHVLLSGLKVSCFQRGSHLRVCVARPPFLGGWEQRSPPPSLP